MFVMVKQHKQWDGQSGALRIAVLLYPSHHQHHLAIMDLFTYCLSHAWLSHMCKGSEKQGAEVLLYLRTALVKSAETLSLNGHENSETVCAHTFLKH